MDSPSKPLHSAGFTLIEAMIVVAILAIIAVIALPSYNDNVQASRRANCVAVLEEARQGVERYFAKNFTYVGVAGGTPGGVGVDFPNKAPKTGSDVYCNITASDLTETTYTLTAAVAGAQSTDKCGDLSVTNAGIRTSSSGLTVDECF